MITLWYEILEHSSRKLLTFIICLWHQRVSFTQLLLLLWQFTIFLVALLRNSDIWLEWPTKWFTARLLVLFPSIVTAHLNSIVLSLSYINWFCLFILINSISQNYFRLVEKLNIEHRKFLTSTCFCLLNIKSLNLLKIPSFKNNSVKQSMHTC